MDLATLIGLIGTISVIMYALIIGGSIFIFIDVTSMIIVLAGTILIILIRWDLNKLISALKITSKVFFYKAGEPVDLINTCLSLAKIARKDGILSLDTFDLQAQPLLKQGVQLLIEGYDQQSVHDILTKDLNATCARHATGKAIFQNAVDVAPAMGVIGTIIGLVQMLSNMNDPKSLGPAMAMALLSMLYGLIIANIICAPIVDKLIYRNEQEYLLRNIIIDALACMQLGQTPQAMALTLKSYLAPELRAKINKAEQEEK
jgi:chemotaxis protein MotA